MNITSVTSPGMLSVHDPSVRRPSQEIHRLVQALERWPALSSDQTSAARHLEERVAAALGKAAAVLMPSGKLAQQIALRIHADHRPGRRVVAAHPANHLSAWEDSNHAVLHGMQIRTVGDRHALLSTPDVAAAAADSDVAAVLWELPQRDLGGELPRWDDLQDQLSLASAAGIATHLDGARIWQVEPYYGRALREICGPFDSVYASLYKDLGAPRGAMLAGSAGFIAEARTWRHRMGGAIDEAWPLALLAIDGLERIPPLMPHLVSHAQEIAAEIHRSTKATVRPTVPHAAMFHVHLPLPADAAQRAHEELVRAGAPALALRIRTGPDHLRSWFEATVGADALSLTPRRIAGIVDQLICSAR